ncbi:MAG: hypothetical protein IJU98_00015, partial [Synergistaceae bacterium]|nr:hypothetical protein [Synergistaceae bacterium]
DENKAVMKTRPAVTANRYFSVTMDFHSNPKRTSSRPNIKWNLIRWRLTRFTAKGYTPFLRRSARPARDGLT